MSNCGSPRCRWSTPADGTPGTPRAAPPRTSAVRRVLSCAASIVLVIVLVLVVESAPQFSPATSSRPPFEDEDDDEDEDEGAHASVKAGKRTISPPFSADSCAQIPTQV